MPGRICDSRWLSIQPCLPVSGASDVRSERPKPSIPDSSCRRALFAVSRVYVLAACSAASHTRLMLQPTRPAEGAHDLAPGLLLVLLWGLPRQLLRDRRLSCERFLLAFLGLRPQGNRGLAMAFEDVCGFQIISRGAQWLSCYCSPNRF